MFHATLSTKNPNQVGTESNPVLRDKRLATNSHEWRWPQILWRR